MVHDATATPHPKGLILAVDDTPAELRFLAHLLETIPCELCLATSGTMALELARTQPPDLILLDVVMPDLDGYAVCERLQAQEATRAIPVIFLTSRTGPEDIVQGFAKGAVDYVSKPFNPPELLARVRTQLELKQKRDAEHRLLLELQQALAEVKQLSGLIPICAGCKKIRDDQGFWQQVEHYISVHSEATFSHGFCPDCVEQYFPGFSHRDETHTLNS